MKLTATTVTLLAAFCATSVIADDKTPATQNSGFPAVGNLFQFGEMAQAASDLKEAGRAFDRFGKSMEVLATSLAAMSSEFDPFGYKTAFRTVGQQAEIIQQQNELIRELQQREIMRLHEELKQVRQSQERPKKKKRRRTSS